jgi:predicted RNA-binding protein YlxR (DUF448 family)
MKDKKELVRIVRTPEGEVLMDSTGKQSGRGVYLCRDLKCLEQAEKGRRLEKSLSHPVSVEVKEALKEALKEASDGRSS